MSEINEMRILYNDQFVQLRLVVQSLLNPGRPILSDLITAQAVDERDAQNALSAIAQQIVEQAIRLDGLQKQLGHTLYDGERKIMPFSKVLLYLNNQASALKEDMLQLRTCLGKRVVTHYSGIGDEKLFQVLTSLKTRIKSLEERELLRRVSVSDIPTAAVTKTQDGEGAPYAVTTSALENNG